MPHTCHTCGIEFTQITNLIRHKRIVHQTGPKTALEMEIMALGNSVERV